MSDPVTPVADTTDQAASTETVTEETEAQVLPRDTMMDDIAARQRATRNADAAEEDPVDETPVSDSDTPAIDETPAETKSDMVMLKVSGREIFKTQAEVDEAGGVDALQKSLAGNIRFEEAAEKEREVARRERELAQERDRFRAEQQRMAQPAQTEQSVAEDTGVDTKQMAEDMFLGDVDAVAANLQKIIGAAKSTPQPRQQQIDPTAVASQAASIVEQKAQLTNALSQFANDFADIDQNPVMKTYANEQTKILMRENPSWTPGQVLTEAGQRTRAAANSTESALSQKQKRKAATVDNVAQATRRATAQGKQSNKPKTPREIFEHMQQGRSH